MAGCRPLTTSEQTNLRNALRRFSPRDRALVTAQLLTGFRVSEVISLTVGSVLRNGQLVSKIGITPKNMKGGYGTTRWIPVLPTLARALESQLSWLRQRYELKPDLPLFLSRQDNPDGTARSVNRETARQIIARAFRRAKILDDGRLGTHVLRKTFARNVYAASGNDLMVLKKALNHSSVGITQRYLDVSEDDVMTVIRKCDRSRPSKTPTSFSSLAPARPVPAAPTLIDLPCRAPSPANLPTVPPALSQSNINVAVVPAAPAPAPQHLAFPTAQLDFFATLAA